MKRYLLFILAFAMAFVGCKSEDNISADNSRVILKVFNDVATRVTFDGQESLWSNGDYLNVVVDGLDEVYSFNYDASTENHFVCDNLQLPADNNDIYALYGVGANYINVADKAATIDLASPSQVQSTLSPTAHIAQYDILYGKTLGAPNDDISIAMNHTIVAVKINILNSLQESKTIKSVTFSVPENIRLSGSHKVNLSTDVIDVVSSDDGNSIKLLFEEPLLLEMNDVATAWIATAPFALVEGDELIIDITTMDEEVYRCTKLISGDGITFNVGSIMSTDITIGGNAPLVEPDTPAEPELPAAINIVVNPADSNTMFADFPASKEANVTSGEFTLDGYTFAFSSPVPFYLSKNNRIRFESGITKSNVAMIKLPVIPNYKLTSVTLASTAANSTRNYMFAITDAQQTVITGGKAYKLTDVHYSYNLTLPSDDTECYICISHTSSSGNTNVVDLSYISLTYSIIE